MHVRRLTLRQLLLLMAAIAAMAAIVASFANRPEFTSGFASHTYVDSDGNVRSYLYESRFYVSPDGQIIEPGYEWLLPYRLLAAGTVLLAVAILWRRFAPPRTDSEAASSCPVVPVSRNGAYQDFEWELIRKAAIVAVAILIVGILFSGDLWVRR